MEYNLADLYEAIADVVPHPPRRPDDHMVSMLKRQTLGPHRAPPAKHNNPRIGHPPGQAA